VKGRLLARVEAGRDSAVAAWLESPSADSRAQPVGHRKQKTNVQLVRATNKHEGIGSSNWKR